MPDRLGLTRATSIGPNREADNAAAWKYGTLPPPPSAAAVGDDDPRLRSIVNHLRTLLTAPVVNAVRQSTLDTIDPYVPDQLRPVVRTLLKPPSALTPGGSR